MKVEITTGTIAYLMNTVREYKRANGFATTEAAKEWAANKIKERPDIFHSYSEDVLKIAACHLCLFCMGEPSQFDAILKSA